MACHSNFEFKMGVVKVLALSPSPTRVGPGSQNFHNSGCLHGDALFHHDIIPECPWSSSGSTQVETLMVE